MKPVRLPDTILVGSSACVSSDAGQELSCGDRATDGELDLEFQPGVVIHERYLLLSCLGRGGMGRVLLAHDQLLDRRVAMKVVAVRIRKLQAEFQEALAREARLGASLNDAGIAAVHDFGVHAGKSYTIFEYVDGETLRSLLARRQKLSLAEVQPLIASLAGSLDLAHSRGIVHRDLKPENICITKRGMPKILDFGIARDLRKDFQLEGFCGTPRYAAPEQAACSATDGRTDQYALGLLAWEMLTGRSVFEADNTDDMLRRHREEEPQNLQTILPDLPLSVVQAIHRALQKDPEKRFGTCAEFANAMDSRKAVPDSDSVRLPAGTAEQRTVYLCSIPEDSLIAIRLAEQLERNGLPTWYYQRDASATLPFPVQSAAALHNSRSVLLLISAAALDSDDFASEVQEASQYERPLIPLLLGLSREDLESHRPAWRSLLGSSMFLEADSETGLPDIPQLIATLEPGSSGPTVEESAPRIVSAGSSAGTFAGQIWATDASQIDIRDLDRVVFRNSRVDDFLRRGNKYFLVGTKGQGKTLLLTYKRHLLWNSIGGRDNEAGLCFVPQGRPYLDFMTELKSLSARFEKPLSELPTCKRFWGLALRVSAIANHPGVVSDEHDDELDRFPPRFRKWLLGLRVEPTVVFKELTNLSISQANALIDDTETFLDQQLRSIHSSTCFFIDKVDQAVRRLGRNAWINIQAGLMEAAWDLMNANSHIRVFASIRQEAFVNYQSDIKANLTGAATRLDYSDEELEQLMDRLCGCYESSRGFKDFLGIRVIRHPRRPIPEDSFRFIRRHSFGRPRDLVVIAAELSAEKQTLSETKYCELVRRASASQLVNGILEEMRVFLDCLDDPTKRMRFFEMLPSNIVSHQEAVTACARFNGVSDDVVRDLGDHSADLFHPFQDLYLSGLLGVVQQLPESDRQVQLFRRPDDLVNCLGADLPQSPFYLLHPALSMLIREQSRAGQYFSFEHVVVGHQLPWDRWNAVFCEIERHLRQIRAEPLRKNIHRLLRRAGEVLRSSTPRNLSVILQAMPEWQETRAQLLSQKSDDLVLWLDELKSVAG